MASIGSLAATKPLRADRYGERSLTEISHEYGRQPIPFGLNRAVRRAVGKDYLTLYDEWQAHLRTLTEHDADAARHQLQEFGRIVDGLRGPAGHEEDEPQA